MGAPRYQNRGIGLLAPLNTPRQVPLSASPQTDPRPMKAPNPIPPFLNRSIRAILRSPRLRTQRTNRTIIKSLRRRTRIWRNLFHHMSDWARIRALLSDQPPKMEPKWTLRPRTRSSVCGWPESRVSWIRTSARSVVVIAKFLWMATT